MSMKITFGPRGSLQIDDARIIFRNFAGEAGKFNREGVRSFAVVIDDPEIAEALQEEGWNVKIKPAREEDDMPRMHLQVKVNFDGRKPPKVYLETCNRKTRLDEESIECLDYIDIASVDMDIRPYDWEVNGKTGRTAYLQNMYVVQEDDRFASRFAEEEAPEEDLPM